MSIICNPLSGCGRHLKIKTAPRQWNTSRRLYLMSESLLGASSIRKIYESPDFIRGCVDSFLETPFWEEFGDGSLSLLGSDRNKIYLSVYLGHTLPRLGFRSLYLNDNSFVFRCVEVLRGLLIRIKSRTSCEFFVPISLKSEKEFLI